MPTIQTHVKGLEAARQVMKQNAEILAGTRGSLWDDETKAIQAAIEGNADPSYKKSPAKEMALKSAETWEHLVRIHKNKIYSTDYANLRQYCEDTRRQATLVEFSDVDIQEQINLFAEALSKS